MTEHLSRRSALTLLGMTGAGAVLAACGSSSSRSGAASTTTTDAATSSTTAAAASCVLTAEQEQGPYYYAAAPMLADITAGKHGVPTTLRLTVQDVNGCKPIANAAVDVSTADALGDYSDTSTGLFLRGFQVTDADGVATFTSIYPGWYPSRTNHVHVKVHIGGTEAASKYTGGHVSHTGNLFFPEDVSVAVAKVTPYTDNPTKNRVTLTEDFVYKGQNGSGSIMTLTPVDATDPANGYTASMVLGIDPTSTPAGLGIAGTVN